MPPPKKALLLEKVLWSTLSVPPLLRTPPSETPVDAPALPSATVRLCSVSVAPGPSWSTRTSSLPLTVIFALRPLMLSSEPSVHQHCYQGSRRYHSRWLEGA